VLITWAWSYVTYRRGARLITGYGLRAAPAVSPAHAGAKTGEATWSDQGSGWSDPGKRAGGAGQ
jgi:hypothetical protein